MARAKNTEQPSGEERKSRRLSLVGRVLATDRAPIANARVRLVSYPPDFGKLVDVRRQVNRSARRIVLPPLEETVTAADGIFFFRGLPAGQYAIAARAPGAAEEIQGGKPVDVGEADARKGAPPSIELQTGSGEKQTASKK